MPIKTAGQDAIDKKANAIGVAPMVGAVKQAQLEMDAMELLEEDRLIIVHSNQVHINYHERNLEQLPHQSIA